MLNNDGTVISKKTNVVFIIKLVNEINYMIYFKIIIKKKLHKNIFDYYNFKTFKL